MDALASGFDKTAPAGLDLVAETPEHLLGPLNGYHLACYTVRTGKGYVGYAKIFAKPPECAWTAEAPLKKLSSGPFSESGEALEAVIAKCTNKLSKSQPSRLSALLKLLMRG